MVLDADFNEIFCQFTEKCSTWPVGSFPFVDIFSNFVEKRLAVWVFVLFLHSKSLG